MKRRMCKKCAKKNRDYYVQRKTTGELVSKIIARHSEVRRTIQCSKCGYTWSYTRRK